MVPYEIWTGGQDHYWLEKEEQAYSVHLFVIDATESI